MTKPPSEFRTGIPAANALYAILEFEKSRQRLGTLVGCCCGVCIAQLNVTTNGGEQRCRQEFGRGRPETRHARSEPKADRTDFCF